MLRGSMWIVFGCDYAASELVAERSRGRSGGGSVSKWYETVLRGELGIESH